MPFTNHLGVYDSVLRHEKKTKQSVLNFDPCAWTSRVRRSLGSCAFWAGYPRQCRFLLVRWLRHLCVANLRDKCPGSMIDWFIIVILGKLLNSSIKNMSKFGDSKGRCKRDIKKFNSLIISYNYLQTFISRLASFTQIIYEILPNLTKILSKSDFTLCFLYQPYHMCSQNVEHLILTWEIIEICWRSGIAIWFFPTSQWIGLRENRKPTETIDFPIFFCGFPVFFSLKPIHWTSWSSSSWSISRSGTPWLRSDLPNSPALRSAASSQRYQGFGFRTNHLYYIYIYIY